MAPRPQINCTPVSSELSIRNSDKGGTYQLRKIQMVYKIASSVEEHTDYVLQFGSLLFHCHKRYLALSASLNITDQARDSKIL
jgi:hypothetical protein